MALMLAPYNDSMRLGMGFNSYTQTMCIDGAVEVTNDDKVKVENPSQVVTYSSKFVERLSDIVSSMNISYSAAIKRGTIEVAGNSNTIDEDKIKASDINLVVSVQVVNQTTTVKDTAQFKRIEGIRPGTPEFNSAFGDCYISGFIQGGEFNSIISMRSLDRTKKHSVVRSIKKLTKTTEPADDFSMDPLMLSNLSNSNALSESEVTVAVNWMGGGQVKDSKTTWDVNSVYEAAAAFPANVAQTPQRTWAILTKYKANRSFNVWATSLSLRPLEYDAVTSYTAELFNNYMEYKQLVKKVQDIISHGEHYTKALKPKAIPIHTGTLVAVRTALRAEMNKIVAVVNALSRNPELLSKQDSFDVVSKSKLVRQIVEDALAASPECTVYDEQPVNRSGEHWVEYAGGEEVADPPARTAQASPTTTKTETEVVKMDLGALIAPEIWAEILPIMTSPEVADQQDDSGAGAAAALFPPPPENDGAKTSDGVDPKKLTIVSAVCGIQDVTQTLQDMVGNDNTFRISISEINNLAQSSVYKELPATYAKSLSFIYQYGAGPTRICSAMYNKNSLDTIEVTPMMQHPEVQTRPWSRESWSILAVVYGGKAFYDDARLRTVEDKIRQEYYTNPGQPDTRRVTLWSEFLNAEDPAKGITKTSVVFFRSTEKGPVRASAGLESKPCLLTDQPQVAHSDNCRTLLLENKLRESEQLVQASNGRAAALEGKVKESDQLVQGGTGRAAALEARVKELEQLLAPLDPKNNLDPTCHDRPAMASLSGDYGYTLDFGADGGTRVHGYGFNANANQRLKLLKTNPADRTSPWLITNAGKYMEWRPEDNRMIVSTVRRTTGEEKKHQEWYIGRNDGREGFLIQNVRFEKNINIMDVNRGGDAHPLQLLPRNGDVGQNFRIHIY